MRILYFSKTTEAGPSSRYRVYQFVPHLRTRGIDIIIRPLFGPSYFRFLTWTSASARFLAKLIYVPLRFIGRGVDLCRLGQADLVIIEGQLFPYMGLMAERALIKRYKVVIELDDAIYLTYRHEKKVPALLRMASGAIVGNRTLARYAGAYTPNVHVIPTVVDTGRFRPTISARHGKTGFRRDVVLVWIGLAFNASYLNLLVPALQRLQKEHRILVRVISSRPHELPGVATEFRAWAYETEVDELQDSDIGVMPLPDTEWARAKCGLKLLQYMAVGIPCVGSPVGVNRDIIRDGDNGFLANSDEEWYARLVALCQDPVLRAKIGKRGRETVETDYSLNQWGPRLADCYRSLADTSDLRSRPIGVANPTF